MQYLGMIILIILTLAALVGIYMIVRTKNHK